MSRRSYFVALLFLFALSTAWSATASLEDGLRHCSLEADEHQRLSCFDALVSALPQIQAENFGMTAPIAHQRDPSAPANKKSDRLAGTISALRQEAYGNLVFTLDNGQIWEQAEPEIGMHFSIGDAVQIEHGTFTSLWLTASHHRSTRVRRIK
jgi:hypothetical protein